MSKTVTVIGTGTIGEPLAGLFTRYQENFGIDEVIVFKNTPLQHDMTKVKQLISKGAVIATDEEKFEKFKSMGVTPKYTRVQAIRKADVVIDCTPQAMNGKPLYQELSQSHQLFLGQGNAKGWGKPFAYGLNDSALDQSDKFVKIVSCNTHSLAKIAQTINRTGAIDLLHFLCIRRANDVSQDGGMVAALEASPSPSHHAEDAIELFKTLGGGAALDFSSMYSSACKINTQYMHAVYFVAKVRDEDFLSSGETFSFKDQFIEMLKEDPRVSITYKKSTNKVFSFGRDYGHYGRILTQTVINIPSLSIREVENDVYELSGFAFTPQDANSLLSSVAATLWHLEGGSWQVARQKMECLDEYLFQEV